MQILFTKMQMRNVHMMQMSHAGVQMQSLSMMVLAHIFKPWCKCLLVSMSWCKYFAMQMHPSGYIMMQMFWCKFIQKFPLFSKSRLLSACNKDIFKSWFVLSRKVIFFFYLRLLKKLVITVRNLRMGHWLGIWWFGSKDLFAQFGLAKGAARFQGFFLKKWIFWKSSILKRFIFL